MKEVQAFADEELLHQEESGAHFMLPSSGNRHRLKDPAQAKQGISRHEWFIAHTKKYCRKVENCNIISVKLIYMYIKMSRQASMIIIIIINKSFIYRW